MTLKQISHWSLQFSPVDSYYSTSAAYLPVIWGCVIKNLSHAVCLCEKNWQLLKYDNLNHILVCKYGSKQLMQFFLASVLNKEQMLVHIRNTHYFVYSKFANLVLLIFVIDIASNSIHLIYTVLILYCLLFIYSSINPAR